MNLPQILFTISALIFFTTFWYIRDMDFDKYQGAMIGMILTAVFTMAGLIVLVWR